MHDAGVVTKKWSEVALSVAEERLRQILTQDHDTDPETQLFIAETEAVVARCLGVSVEDLVPPEPWRISRRKRGGIPTGRPHAVYLRLPDQSAGSEVTLVLTRAWPGTADAEWCLTRREEIVGSRGATHVEEWYFAELSRAAIVQAAMGNRPARFEGPQRGSSGTVIWDAYDNARVDHSRVHRERISKNLSRLAERLAPEREA